MADHLDLPAGTHRVSVADIPRLFATAIHPRETSHFLDRENAVYKHESFLHKAIAHEKVAAYDNAEIPLPCHANGVILRSAFVRIADLASYAATFDITLSVDGQAIEPETIKPASASVVVEQVAPAKAKARGGRPKTIDKKVFAVREMMTRFERVASIKFTPKALSGSAVDLLDACQRFEKSNKIKPLIFSTSQDTFNHWLKHAGYSFPTGRTPNAEKNYWTKLLVVKVSV